MAKQTSTQTYRVSDEVDAELRKLAKVHGGIDKALRVLFEWEVDPSISTPTFRTTKEAMMYAQQHHMPTVIPALPETGLLPCRHCGEDGKISAKTNPWRACGSCAQDGHLNFQDCRRCAEIAHARKMAASPTGVDDPGVEYDNKGQI